MASVQWASSKAVELINEFKFRGLIDNQWTFGWNRRKSSFGLCSYTKKEISLSYYYAQVGSYEQINDTILHELAHAIAGPSAGHGELWKKACKVTGANPVRCGKVVDEMPCKFKGTCPVCGHVYKAQRVLQQMDRRLCSKKGCNAKKFKQYVKWEVWG